MIYWSWLERLKKEKVGRKAISIFSIIGPRTRKRQREREREGGGGGGGYWLLMKGQHREEFGSIIPAVSRKTEAVVLGNEKKEKKKEA